jgi:Family of unknown function (DUF6178)
MSHEPVSTLTLVQGGNNPAPPLTAQAMEQILAELGTMPAKRRLNTLLSHPHGRKLVRALPATDIFWLVKELGIADSNELIELASREQLVFCLDLDVWEKWTLQPERFFEWLSAILESELPTALAKIREMDQEMMILFLKHEIKVGGGLQLPSSDDEQVESWDQTFDDVYSFNYLNKDHAVQISQFLELLFQNDRDLFVCLLEGVRSELATDLEEVSYRFRAGRLGDYGFPELSEALGLFSYIDPDSYVPATAKDLLLEANCPFIPIPVQGNNLLTRALAGASGAVLAELRVLFNTALVAEAAPFADSEAIVSLCNRVCSYLNLALEHYCGDDERRATEILEQEYLKRLCQVGFSLVHRLHRQAKGLSRGTLKANHPTERALDGIIRRHPQFYRALDEDHVDGYRDFRSLVDLSLMQEFLASLSGD